MPNNWVLNRVKNTVMASDQALPINKLWHGLQGTLVVIGLAIVGALLWAPTLGLHLLWDVLIPAAPLLFVLVPGFWRNVCPVSTTAMLAQRSGYSLQRKIAPGVAAWLGVAGVVLLYLAVPLRHAIFDLNGTASAVFLIVAALIACALGATFAWKSAWCAGLCPVRPVEAMYGFRPAARFANAHCGQCASCSSPCPDSTAEAMLTRKPSSLAKTLADAMMVGGFVGFIWGWFHVADFSGTAGWQNLGEIYAWPFAAAGVTGAVYWLLLKLAPQATHAWIRQSFACAAVSCYYWYRLPMLLGFGLFPGDGMLVDLSASLPVVVPQLLPFCTTAFFVWWMVVRPHRGRAWMIRPPMLPRQLKL
jgi:hypothetical protein